MALTILGSGIPKMRDELLKIIPKLKSNVFDLKSVCNNFVAFEKMFIDFKRTHLKKGYDLDFQLSQNILYEAKKCLANRELKEGETSNAKRNEQNETKTGNVSDQYYLTKKRNKFKRHKKLNPGKVILIDLTKSKKTLESLKPIKKTRKKRKRTDEIKNQVKIVNAHSTEYENLSKKFLSEDLPISDNKVSENGALIEQQDSNHCDSQNDYYFNKKETDAQSNNKILYLRRKENKDENVTSQHTFSYINTTNESSEIDPYSTDESFKQLESYVEYSSNECQSNGNVQFVKEELANTDCYVTEEDAYYQNEFAYVHSDYLSHQSMNNQITEAVKQKLYHDTHECVGCCKKLEAKPFSYHNNSVFNTIMNEDITLSDLDKCMDVLNRIKQHIMTVHAEKQRLESLDVKDACAVSTTVSESEEFAEPSPYWIQNINSGKFNRILEFHGKNDGQDFHAWEKQETDALSNQLKLETSDQKIMFPPNDHFIHDTIFPESGSPSKFICNPVKSEFESFNKQENLENFEMQYKISAQTHDAESFVHKKVEDLSEDFTLQKYNETKSLENAYVLDSVLDKNRLEVWEDSESLLMTMNSFTNYITQSEYIDETEEKYVLTETENSKSPKHSLQNDFMCSTTHTIDTRLIKRNCEDEDENIVALHSGENEFTFEKSNSRKRKESYVNHPVEHSMDVVGFGLNVNRKETEFPWSIDWILSQEEDDVQSWDMYGRETSPFTVKHSLGSCDLLSSTDLMPNATLKYILDEKPESSSRQKKLNTSLQKQETLLNFHEDLTINAENYQRNVNKSTTNKRPAKVSDNIPIKSSANTQNFKFIKEQVTTVEEDIPRKRRKTNITVPQKLQKKHIVSAKKGGVCTNVRKNVSRE